MPTEMALEELLARNPEMLGSGLKLVGRQTRTKSGWLDLLAVDQDGRLVVYELKRGTLARDAVTQVLDYASDLDAMSTSELAGHIAECSGNDSSPRNRRLRAMVRRQLRWGRSLTATAASDGAGGVGCRIPLPSGWRNSSREDQWTCPW